MDGVMAVARSPGLTLRLCLAACVRLKASRSAMTGSDSNARASRSSAAAGRTARAVTVAGDFGRSRRGAVTEEEWFNPL